MANVFYQKGKKYNCVKNGVPYFRKTAVIGGKQRSFYGDGEKDVLKKIEAAKALERGGYDFDTRNSKTGDVFRHWLFDIKRMDKNIKPHTFTAYECQFRNHLQSYPIAETKMSAFTSGILQRHINNMYENGEASGKTIEYFIRLVKQFCKWAIREGYLVKNPCDNIVIPGEHEKKKEVETFSKEERAALLAYMDSTGYWYDTLIKLAFATGMRQGELLALRWGDIEDDVIHVRHTLSYFSEVDAEGNRTPSRGLSSPKTINGERVIPMLESTQEMLREHHLAQKKYMLAHGLSQTDYVFTNNNGQPVYSSTLGMSYKRLLNRAGIPYKKFHAIRHTFATEALLHGVPVKDLQTILGHSDIATTYIYVHSTTGTKRNAIEMIGEVM